MKKYIIIMLLVVLLIGCESDDEISNTEESVISDEVVKFLVFDEYLDVSTSIDHYHLVMSSVPGLPLELKVLKDGTEYTIDISVSAGRLLSLEDSIIEELGDKVFIDYKDLTLYWSPLDEVVVENADILIEVKEGDEVVAKASYQISLTDDGYILMHTVFTVE